MTRPELRLPTSEDIQVFEQINFLNPESGPIPFLRSDLIIKQQIGYTDGSENVTISPGLLYQLSPVELVQLLTRCGRLLDPVFVIAHGGPTPDILAVIFAAAQNPVYFIGSRARSLAHAINYPATQFKPDVIRYCQGFYRTTNYPDQKDFDFLVSPEDLPALSVAFPATDVNFHPSRTSPGGQILDIVNNSSHLQFLSFPGENYLIDHIYGAIDFPDAVFAEILAGSRLRLQDPVGTAYMQPQFSHPPYPDYFIRHPMDNRLIRGAIMAAVTSGKQCPDKTREYLKRLGHLYNSGIWQSESIPQPVAESLAEAYANTFTKSPNIGPETVRLLGETELLPIIIRSAIQSLHQFALKSLYVDLSIMFEYVKGSVDLNIFKKFYRGQTLNLTTDNIREALMEIAVLPASFFASLEFSSDSCFFDKTNPLTQIIDFTNNQTKRANLSQTGLPLA